MDTRNRIARLVSVLVLLAIASHSAIAQQAVEQPLSVTGDLMSGYSGLSNGGVLDSGPYVGFEGLARGFWKDPRILTFAVSPNYGRGITRTGSMGGGEGEGVNANATFLSGSRIPVSFMYSYQFIPVPELNRNVSDFEGVSLTRKQFGVDWGLNLKRLPPLQFSYHRSTDESELPGLGMGANKTRDFMASTQYRLAGWNLSANYNNTHGESGGEAKDGTETVWLQSSDTGSQTASATALHDLPLRSKFLVQGNWTATDLNIQQTQTNANYKNLTASLTSQPIDRLSLDFRTGYLSNVSDFLRSQVLTSANPTDITQLLAQTLGRETLTYGAGASFRIIRGLNVTGNYNATEPLSDTGVADFGGAGHGIGAGINFNRRIHSGEFFAAYDHSIAENEFADVTTGVLGHDTSSSDAVSMGYSRTLPFAINASASGSYNLTQVHYTSDDTLRSWSMNLRAVRKLNSGWMLSGNYILRNGSHEFPTRESNGAQTFAATLESKRLQFTGTYNRTYGLAYILGARVIFVPSATQLSDIPGLPLLTESDSSLYSVSAGYKVSRRLSVNGAYYHGSSTSTAAFANLMSGYDTNARYKFRQVWLVAGYRRDLRSFDSSVNPAFTGQSFYVMVRRHFTLF
jgi:hypothetical protein